MGGKAWAEGTDSAVVLMYHRFGDSPKPSTNIGLERFEGHLRTLLSGGYHVLPLSQIVAALKEGRPLPDRTVAITLDGATDSGYREAWPRLRAAKLPFTVFLSTDEVDAGARGFMNWDQVRAMAKAGVDFGVATCSHSHLPALKVSEAREDIACGLRRFEQEVGIRPSLFSYPYGEASREVVALAREAGFQAAFGDHSGPMSRTSDFHFLPRFPMDHSVGPGRMLLIFNSLPLPVENVSPADPAPGTNPPEVAFTVGEAAGSLEALFCYASNGGDVQVIREGRRVTARPLKPFPPTRGRLNCTQPPTSGRWRWLGQQFYFPALPSHRQDGAPSSTGG
ncbi:MAG: polysaccharide deacetylase family protein [Alphaproteobacteria bacterium]